MVLWEMIEGITWAVVFLGVSMMAAAVALFLTMVAAKMVFFSEKIEETVVPVGFAMMLFTAVAVGSLCKVINYGLDATKAYVAPELVLEERDAEPSSD